MSCGGGKAPRNLVTYFVSLEGPTEIDGLTMIRNIANMQAGSTAHTFDSDEKEDGKEDA